MKSLTLDSPRIRFNWGFHDGAHDKLNSRDRRNIREGQLFCLPSFDSAYCDGYQAGQSFDVSAGRPESSEPAWREHQADKQAKREQRKALASMRADSRIVRV